MRMLTLLLDLRETIFCFSFIDCCRSPAQGPGYRLHRDRKGIISGLAYQVGATAGPGEVSEVAGGEGNLMNRFF